MKKSFALVITLTFLIVLSLYMVNIVENKTLFSNINKLKYLHLQSKIHLKYIKEYILTHNDNDIEDFNLNDERFNLYIDKIEQNNTKSYYISLKAKNEPIRDVVVINK